jgi:hypothetical protein
MLVRDLNTPPQNVVLPKLDGDGLIKYALEYNGLLNQCGRCRSTDLQVRHCPKREGTTKRIKPYYKASVVPIHKKTTHPPKAVHDPTPVVDTTPLATIHARNNNVASKHESKSTP